MEETYITEVELIYYVQILYVWRQSFEMYKAKNIICKQNLGANEILPTRF